MVSITFTDLVLYFAVYSIIGWVCEVTYCSIFAKRLVRRGFLAGPYCPIYGFGAIALIAMLYPLAQRLTNLPLLFIAAVIITSALEYFTSWLMEKLFNMRWWDYSKHRFNLNGRICLVNSILFGIMSIVLLYVIQPLVNKLIFMIPIDIRTVISSLFIAVILIDLITTLNEVYKLDAKLKEIQSTLHSLKEYDKRFSWYDKNDTQTSLIRLENLAEKYDNENVLELVERIKRLLTKDNSGKRLLASFSRLRSNTLHDNMEIVKQAFAQRRQKRLGQESSSEKLQKSKESQPKEKSEEDTQVKSFAKGLNFYKLFWVFFLASFIGYMVEIIFCFITNGYVESRQGMIYGPFSQVYGFGAVMMVLFLHKLAQKGDRWVFIGSALVGGVFEAICSFIQESMFNSVSWNYTEQTFSFFGGRTSLLYMFFWGFLGVAFIREIYPRLSRFVERIPNKQGIILSWLLVAFISFDMLISAFAVHRWSERIRGIEPENRLETYLDEKYPDDFMKIIYPNMNFSRSG